MAFGVNNSLPVPPGIGYQPPAMTSASLHRLARLSWADRALLAEALAALALASLAIRLLPFKRVVGAASVFGRPSAALPPADDRIEKTVWAVLAAARRVPWKTVCFQRGLAVHAMLRRRRVGSLLHYGVAKADADGLKAHVWVSVADRIIVGGAEAPDFTCLATYPAVR